MVTNVERREERARRNARMSRGDRIFGLVNAALLWIVSIIMLYPLLYVVACSFSDPLSVVQSRITLLPQGAPVPPYRAKSGIAQHDLQRRTRRRVAREHCVYVAFQLCKHAIPPYTSAYAAAQRPQKNGLRPRYRGGSPRFHSDSD